MWKRLAAGLAVFLLLLAGTAVYLAGEIRLRHDHVSIPPTALAQPHSPAAVRADVAALVETLARNHPDFAAIGGDTYATRIRELAAELSQPLTRLAAYRLFGPLNGLLRDGHSYLTAPAEERSAYLAAGGLFPPFLVRFAADGLVIRQSLDPALDLAPGDRLVAVNDRDAASLAAFCLALQSGENLPLRRAYAERSFPRSLWAAGLVAPFEISVRRGDGFRTMRHPGLSRDAYATGREARARRENAYEELRAGVGLLVFADMPSPDRTFRRFLATTFRTIREREIATLIIDLRDNGGGDSRAGDALLRYLTADRLPAVEHVDVKVTREIKAYYRTLLPRGFRWIPLHRFVEVLQGIADTAPGEIFRLHPPPRAPLPREDSPENAFRGRLMVLIGPRTYSSAVIFAAPLKHFGRAIFVGAQTGEPLIFYGENYPFDLPNTGLEAQVSHKRFVLVGATDETAGIIPDLPADDALAAALGLIETSP